MNELIKLEGNKPEDGLEYLVWCGWVDTGFYYSELGGFDNFHGYYVHDVTHYMTIPEGPKE